MSPRLAAAAATTSCSLALAAAAASSSPAAQCEPPPVLLQAHVIFRHGARTPVFWDPQLGIDTSQFRGQCADVNSPPGVAGAHAVPSSIKTAHLELRALDGKSARPHSAVDQFQLKPQYEECRVGQLTTLGARQSAQLGRTLRERYGALADAARQASSNDSSDGLFIRTSNVARCVATLQFVLGELFPHDRAAFVGVTAPSHEEYLYPNPTHCELTSQLMHSARIAWEQRHHHTNHTDDDSADESRQVVAELERALPPAAFQALRISPGANFVRVRDYLVSYRAHGLAKPWTALDDRVARQVERLGAMQVAAFIHHQQGELGKLSARAGVGNLLRLVRDAIVLAPSSATTADTAAAPARFSLISAHDTTLMPILSALDVWHEEEEQGGLPWPDFCAWVAFELYSDGRVALVFNGRTVRAWATQAEFDACMRELLPDQEWKVFCSQPPQHQQHGGGGGGVFVPPPKPAGGHGDTW